MCRHHAGIVISVERKTTVKKVGKSIEGGKERGQVFFCLFLKEKANLIKY